MYQNQATPIAAGMAALQINTTATMPPQPCPEVVAAFNILSDSIDSLEKLANELATRLENGGLLRQVPAETNGTGPGPAPFSSGLAQGLHNKAMANLRLSVLLRETIDRLAI